VALCTAGADATIGAFPKRVAAQMANHASHTADAALCRLREELLDEVERIRM
jgi:hypothetical protein